MDNKQTDKKISAPRLAVTVIAFVLIVGIIVLGAVNIRRLSLDNMVKTLRTWIGIEERADHFYYPGEGAKAVVELGGGVLEVSGTEVNLFDQYGDKLLERAAVFDAPVIVSGGGIAGIYDQNGKTLLTVDEKGVDRVYEAENAIISASINGEGWITLCSQEESYKGSVTVLNGQRKAVYKLYSGDGYLVGAALDDSSSRLAAIKLTADGSKIVEYTLDSDKEKSSALFSDTVALRCGYSPNDDLWVITDRGYYVLSADGTVKGKYEPEGALAGFSPDGEGFSAILYEAEGENAGAYLVSIDDFGGSIAKQQITDRVIDISASGQYVGVLRQGGLTVYDKSLIVQRTYSVQADAARVMMLSDGRAIVTGEYSAEVFGNN